ncbi:fimbria/pilus outer membrane usher protein [Pseudotabrizicola sp. 4114]|uniref:fimbria/pilus outer membrane usher protein n=1 Tax=Pseudotabrizicola sp. 4114 TaxID=2817731 RepID=UPI00285D67D0|nr:outer membrane usher protein [Pseudorhodobacter sp. 4114]
MRSWTHFPVTAIGLCIVGWASVLASGAQTRDEIAQLSAEPAANGGGSDYDPDADEALFLLISINGRDTGLVAEVALSRQSQRMTVQRHELEGIGISAPRHLGQSLFLDQIPGLAFVYDAPGQALHLTARGAALIPVEISAVPRQDRPEAQAGFGVVLNYRVTANLGDNLFADGFRPKEAFASLDLRAFTPLGVLTTTGTVSSRFNEPVSAAFNRHDTAFTVSSPGRMMSLTAGDFTTSGPAWARPVRLGGLQIRRDFSLRDDVVTSPLLSFSGSPAVPSSLEVYVDNVRAYSGAVAAGPFNLSNVPMITSGGEAIFVLRDAAGNEQTTMVPFFATQNLLTGGMLDYSFEAGRARLPYGDGRSSYGKGTAVAASLRYGVSDRLTLEARAETLGALKMAGFGVHTVLFNRAEVTLAGGKSVNGPDTGSFVFGAMRTEVGGVAVRLSSRRTFGAFQDLATVTSPDGSGETLPGISSFGDITALDALTLTFPVLANTSSLGLSLINSERAALTNTIFSVSYARQLPWRAASVRVNAFKDVAGDGGFGASIGLSMLLGTSDHASVGLQRDRYGRTDTVTSLSRAADRRAGSYGYRANLSRQNRAFGATYQSRFGRADLALRDSTAGASASATFDGALVMAGGGVFASNRIQDGFAVLDLGLAGVPVSLNNREVAQTGPQGRALVPDLRSYRLNRVSIDPLDLPSEASIAATAMDVVPARRSGVVLDFGGQPDAAALVVLRDANGTFLAPGTEVRLAGSSAAFPVGYDGEVWITGLGARNQITAQTAGGNCSASFAYARQAEDQVYIEGVECR